MKWFTFSTDEVLSRHNVWLLMVALLRKQERMPVPQRTQQYLPLSVAQPAHSQCRQIRALGDRQYRVYQSRDEDGEDFTLDGRCMTLDKSLDAMQQQLDPREFFRANRQYIIARKAVRDISHWFKSKLRVNMLITPPDDIVVPNTSAAEFKQWMVMG